MTRRALLLRLPLLGLGMPPALGAGPQPQRSEGEYLVTEHGAVGDGRFDNAPVLNRILANLPSSGGTLVLPHGDFRIASPLKITRSFVTLRGLNYGLRSHIDAPVAGISHPGGGSKLLLGPSCAECVLMSKVAVTCVSVVVIRYL